MASRSPAATASATSIPSRCARDPYQIQFSPISNEMSRNMLMQFQGPRRACPKPGPDRPRGRTGASLADLPRQRATLHGDRTAVVFEDTRMTYAELDRRVNRAAHALISLGLRPGERLAILSDNSARYLETYLAAAKLGVSVTPLNIRLGD